VNKFRKLSLSLAVSVVSASVMAQSENESTNDLFLEEVIVTAQHRAESLQDAAIPISVATGAELARQGVTDVGALNKISPALQVNRSGGANASFFVRGVGNFTSNGYTDPAVAFNVDGVYVGRPTSTTASFLDVQRIEVLKGPQGTLYGRNATGGAINVIPNKPLLGETNADVSVGYGNFEALEASAAVNIALGESTAVRIAASLLENDGYLDDGTTSTDDVAIRAQLFSEVSDTFDARISVDYSESKGTGPSPVVEGNYVFNAPAAIFEGAEGLDRWEWIASPSNVSDPTGGYFTDATQNYLTGTDIVETGEGPLPSRELFIAAPGFLPQDGNEPSFLDNQYFGITAEFNLDTSIGKLTVIPAYRRAELLASQIGAGFKGLVNDEVDEQTSLEVRFAGELGNVDWLVGAYYFDETVEANFNPTQFQLNSIQDYESTTESEALFGRLTFNITDEFRLVAGARYTADEKSFDGVANTLIVICPLGPPAGDGCLNTPALPVALTFDETLAEIEAAGSFTDGPPTILPNGVLLDSEGNFGVPYGPEARLINNRFVLDEPQTEYEPTFKLSAEFDVTPDSLVYVGYETGYRSGGFNLAPGRETYDSEFLDAFTLGSKNRFMDNRLQLNAEAFYWKYEDQQVAHPGLDDDGGNTFFTENIGESTIYGLDVDLLFQAAENTLVSASFQYLKNELDEFVYEVPDAAANGGGPPPGFITPINGCSNTSTTDSEFTDRDVYIFRVDCSGEEGLQSPEFSANVGIEQGFDLSDDLGLDINLDVRYRDAFWAGTEFLDFQRQEAATKVDLSFTLRPGSEDWFVTLWGRNITDENTSNNRFLFGNTGNLATITYDSPATYGIRGGMSF